MAAGVSRPRWCALRALARLFPFAEPDDGVDVDEAPGLSRVVQRHWCVAGGFLLQAILGRPNSASIGIAIEIGGAVLLATAIVILVFGLVRTPSSIPSEGHGTSRLE